MLDPAIETEVATLAARYGTPRRVAVELDGGLFRPISATDRIGEVCMVVRRTNGRLLTAIKTFYPPGAFRLLTGGIDHGEPIEAALLRETAEETGLEVVVRRFLAVIEYRLRPQDGGRGRHHETRPGEPGSTPPDSRPCDFVTFAFLLDETGGTLGTQDAKEQIGAFREVEVSHLAAMAAALEGAPDAFHPEIVGSWRDWGRFRAVVHRVVYAALHEDRA